MKLKAFRVTKFRNVVDSGPIPVDEGVTCLVGKNEAGKSGLLEALYLFNPAYKDKFDVEDQYPRWLVVQDRRAGDLREHSPVAVTFELEQSDHQAVSEVLGANVLTGNEMTVERQYDDKTKWAMPWSEKNAVRNLVASLPTAIQPLVKSAVTLTDVRKKLTEIKADEESGPTAADLLAANRAITERGLHEVGVWQRIVNVLSPRLPKFFRFSNYSTLPGRIDFEELSAGGQEGPGRSGLQTARALLALAGTDLTQLGNEDYELRKGELEAVQIDLTNQVFEFWKQNPDLEVLIDVDKETVNTRQGTTAVARYLDVRLRDKRTGYSNNFSQRSSGFQWFFSFLAAFSEFSEKESPVVLLDEPALTLHGRAQADFLRFINVRLAKNAPVLYTTHSPFMVEADHLERVRIVEDHGPPKGATASSDILAVDRDSLFPLQAALGYDIAQNLFVGPHNLVVEGTSDYIYLTVMSGMCVANGRTGLDDRWRILPAGSAANIPTFVSLIGPHLDVTVLADSDTKGMQRISSMIDRKLLDGHRLILASAARGAPEADIEDVFSESDYLKMYNKTYRMGVKLSDLPKGDRIVKRIETHRGSAFIHGEVAETLLRTHHELTFEGSTLDAFAALFNALNATIES